MREREREERGRAPIFPRVWLTSCQHVFYLPDVSRSPLLAPRTTASARARVHTDTRKNVLDGAHIPGVSRSCLPERRPPPSLILILHAATSLGLSSLHRWAIRPRLSHRYSRGLLEARGKMRQVVVRSRSPGTREYACFFSPSFVRSICPSARSAATERHSFVWVY